MITRVVHTVIGPAPPGHLVVALHPTGDAARATADLITAARGWLGAHPLGVGDRSPLLCWRDAQGVAHIFQIVPALKPEGAPT